MELVCSQPPGLHPLPNELLVMILGALPLSSIATLALTSKRMLRIIDDFCSPFAALNRRGNEFERANFLLSFDALHPTKKLCFACGGYHPQYVKKVLRARTRLIKRRVVVQYQCAREQATFPGDIRIDQRIRCWSDFHEIMRGFRHSFKHGDPWEFVQYHPPGYPKYWFEAY
jgi:hypothetical protein